MQRVTLKPNTKRLKQLIQAHGKTWRVLHRQLVVPCFNGEAGLFIEAEKGDHSRWVRPTDVEEV